MTEFIQALISGLQAGAIYGLIALGLALVFKATKVLNFAHGEFGSIAALLAWVLIQDDTFGMSLWLASPIVIAAAALISVLVYLLVVRPLRGRTAVITLVATAGVAFGLITIERLIEGNQGRPFPEYISGVAFSVLGAPVLWQTIMILIILGAAALALALFFQTPAGVAVLATAQEPFAAELYGISTDRMAIMVWAIAGALAGIGGLMIGAASPVIGAGIVTGQFLIPAFIGAVLGGLTSMPGAVVGGLLLGVIQRMSDTYLPDAIPGPSTAGVFAVLVIVLLVRPQGLLGKEA